VRSRSLGSGGLTLARSDPSGRPFLRPGTAVSRRVFVSKTWLMEIDMRTLRVSQMSLVLALVAASVPAIAQSSTTSSNGSRGGTSARSVGQSNPGTLDLARPADPNQVRNLPGAPGPGSTAPQTQSLGTTGAVTTPLLPNSNGFGQTTLPATSSRAPTLGAATSGGIVSPGATASPGTTSAPGTTASTGATGRNMPECMSAWDPKTHITKSRWREICARTLTEPHI
jgi:hypothetical protein